MVVHIRTGDKIWFSESLKPTALQPIVGNVTGLFRGQLQKNSLIDEVRNRTKSKMTAEILKERGTGIYIPGGSSDPSMVNVFPEAV